MATHDGDDELEDISPHVHLTISKEKKKRWMEYAEEHSRGNLSSLIEEAVDKTLSEFWILESESGPDIDLSNLDGGMDGITDRLDAIQEQMDVLAEYPAEKDDSLNREELIQLAARVNDTIPLVADESELADLQTTGVTLPEKDRARMTGTVEDLAAHLEEDPGDILQACLFLENDEYQEIHSVVEDGERRWYELKSRGTE